MIKVLVLGKDGRVHCIADALSRSAHTPRIHVVAEAKNPGIASIADITLGKTNDSDFVVGVAENLRPDFVIVGPEEPLALGVVDALAERLGIPCVGPTRQLAQLESSKSFTRRLLEKYDIPGNPEHRVFSSLDGIRAYLIQLGEFVVKPDGLTAGKGVKVFGEHLRNVDEALLYCKTLFDAGHPAVVIEERLVGREFSLQSLCDGEHVVDLPVAQDHKRALEGNEGPNTGGMGSYSCADHRLPFLSVQDVERASRINARVAEALRREFDAPFRGVLYGGFIATAQGLRLLEYNARFGDPEVMNVLPILETDFVDVCEAIVRGKLDRIDVEFEDRATVCKYVVPRGYPENPVRGARIGNVPRAHERLRVYYAAVEARPDGLYLTGSRAVACVGIGANVFEAEQIAEEAARRVEGPVTHRSDIGTPRMVHP